MAATNYTPIILYHSITASAAPTAGNLNNGELAINITDGKLFYKDNGGVVQVIATKGTGVIGGSDTQVQYNSSGALAGSANFTFNGTTASINTLNLTTALGAAYGGTGQSSYTTGDIIYATGATALSKLTIGANTTILTSNGSAPQWSAASAISVNTATNLAGGAAGSLPYQSGAGATTFLSIGSTNRVLTSSGSAPQWVTALSDLTGVSSNIATLGGSGFTLPAVLSVTAPAKLYINTSTVTDGSSAIGATNALGAITSFDATTVAATNANVTYTNLATLVINAVPVAGTNVTITNPYALYVAAGASYFGSTVTVNGTVNATTLDLTNLEVTNIKAKDGTAAMSIADSTGVVTFIKDEVVNGVTVGRGAGAVASNTAVGASALAANTTGVNNTAVGNQAGQLNTIGTDNVYVGSVAGYNAIGSSANVGVGSQALRNATGGNNTGIGYYSGTAITSGAFNTSLGAGSLFSNTTASNNTAVGYQSLYANTTASNNTAVGYQAAYSNTTGTSNTAVGFQSQFGQSIATQNTSLGMYALYSGTGSSNVAIGYLAMGDSGKDSNYNVAVGVQALQKLTTGGSNIAMGLQALLNSTTASNNTVIGYQAGYSNTFGTNNTAIGLQALYANTTGVRATAVGMYALYANTFGDYNTAVGYASLVGNTTGTNNTAVGYQSAYSNTRGIRNTVVGQDALYTNQTGNTNDAFGFKALEKSTASDNVAFGAYGLQENTTGTSNTAVGQAALNKNTIGSYNTAVGYQAGYSNTTGTLLTAVGYLAATSNTIGTDITAFGQRALKSNTTGISNTAIGSGALESNTTGSSNLAVGRIALYANNIGSNNIAVGEQALFSNTTGSYNTAVGYQAGYQNTISNGSTFVGYYAGQNSTGTTNTFVGYGAGYLVTSGTRNTIVGAYTGNLGGLDIRTLSNNIVLSDGDGEPRIVYYNTAPMTKITGTLTHNVADTQNKSQINLYDNTNGNTEIASGYSTADFVVATGGATGNIAYTGRSTNYFVIAAGLIAIVGTTFTVGSNTYTVSASSSEGYVYTTTDPTGEAATGTLTNLKYATEGMRVLDNRTTRFRSTISVGNETPSTSGAGITFPATQSASSNANTLDDYEEGTWTPTDVSGAGLTFTMTGGNYTKIGRQVIVYFNMTFPSTANSAGITIGGLPYPSASAAAVSNPGGGGFTYQTASISNVSFAIGASASSFNMWTLAGVQVPNSNASTYILRGYFTYFTD